MTNLSRNSVRLFFFTAMVLMLPFSCDDKWQSNIPYAGFQIDVNLANATDLNVPGNYIYFPDKGYAGVILYCDDIGVYSAYDAACTHDVLKTCSLCEKGAINGSIGTCPCCGSKFVLLGGGYVIKGPAIEPLKQYHVQILNNGASIRVYN